MESAAVVGKIDSSVHTGDVGMDMPIAFLAQFGVTQIKRDSIPARVELNSQTMAWMHLSPFDRDSSGVITTLDPNQLA